MEFNEYHQEATVSERIWSFSLLQNSIENKLIREYYWNLMRVLAKIVLCSSMANQLHPIFNEHCFNRNYKMLQHMRFDDFVAKQSECEI